jgi:hypothetical protein
MLRGVVETPIELMGCCVVLISSFRLLQQLHVGTEHSSFSSGPTTSTMHARALKKRISLAEGRTNPFCQVTNGDCIL